MWVKLEQKARRGDDLRFRMLAQRLHVSLAEAVVRCCAAWEVVYELSGATLTPGALTTDLHVDAAADLPGFAAAMVAVNLAEERPEGLYLRGTRDRTSEFVQWRRNMAERQRSRQPRSPAYVPARGTIVGAPTNDVRPDDRTDDRPDAQGSRERSRVKQEDYATRSLELALPLVGEQAKPEPQPRAKAAPGHQQVVAHFHERFCQRHGGAKPTWDKRAGEMIRQLLAQHTPEEVCRRIDVLFDAPPAFLAGESPTVATLRANFDRLAAPARGRAAPARDVRVGHVAVGEGQQYANGEVKL